MDTVKELLENDELDEKFKNELKPLFEEAKKTNKRQLYRSSLSVAFSFWIYPNGDTKNVWGDAKKNNLSRLGEFC